MERVSDIALDILNELHTEHLAYQSEYLPLVECVNKCSEYEDTGLEPEEVSKLKADYDRLNDLEQSQILALMQKNSELEAKIKDLKALVAPRLPY